MDKYRILDLDDAEILAKKLMNGENVVFNFCLDDINSYVVFIAPQSTKIGEISFGIHPLAIPGYFAVGVLLRGFFYFDMLSNKLYPSYVGEKLELCKYDAEEVTKMLNAIHDELLHQSKK